MKIFRRGGALSFILGAALLLAVLSIGITKETPLGSIAGSVRMSESGLPLPGSAIIITPVSPAEENQTAHYTFSDKKGAFHLASLPAGEYKIEASAKAHELAPTHISVLEGVVTPLDLELTPKDPELRLYTSQRVFMPDESAEVEAHGFGQETKLAIKVYKIDVSQFLKAGSIEEALRPLSQDYGTKQSPDKVGTLVSSFDHPIENSDAEGAFTDVVTLKSLPEGFYWVQCSMGDLSQGAFINVSKIALVTKSSPGQSLCFVTDLKTGKPISGAEISINTNKQFAVAGKTDANGLARIQIGANQNQALAFARAGSSLALSGWYARSEGQNAPDNNVTIFAYTDRPVYRPGDDVQFKGFVRKRVGSDYTMPNTGTITCDVSDSNGSTVKTFDVNVQPNGSFTGHFPTTDDTDPGQYTFKFGGLGGSHEVYFTLAYYRKPEFSITVRWSKPHYNIGEKMQAKVKCEYYFGGPVVGAKVEADVLRNQDWSYMWSEDESDYGDSTQMDNQGEGGGDYVKQMSATTDTNGEATFEFVPNAETESQEAGFTPNYVYTLEANVTEAGDKFFSGQGSVKVSQGAFNISVDPALYIAPPGKVVDVAISALKTEDDSPRAGQTLAVTYGLEKWTGNQSIFMTIGQTQITTGRDGIAHLSVSAPTEGNLLIRATGIDELGSVIKQQGYIYIGTDEFQPPPAASALMLTLDKKLYQPGDTCKALIVAGKPGVTALVTVEAEKVLWTKVVTIEKQSAVVDIPVDKAYLPRVNISVVAVQNKKFLESSKPLKTDISTRKLQVAVTADQTQYLPGAKATYTLRTTGPGGKAEAADVSLAVVDEAIYAIQEDTTNPLKAFYPARENKVETSYSFPELYLDGGDKGGDVPVRINFKDTAAWVPSVHTDATGTATVQVVLPDNLTRWRATAIGVSDRTDVGLGKTDVTVAKLLMIRLQGPKFMIDGDNQQVAAIVTNNSGRDADVNVLLQPTGFTTKDRLSRRIHLDNGKSDSVSWSVQSSAAGKANLVAKAWIDNGPNDGVQQVIPVEPHARLVTYSTAGEVRDSTTFKLSIRDDVDPSAGRLKVTFSPTMATAIYGSLDQVIGYPYGCVEQTMSRFFPAIIAAKSLKQIGALRPDLEKKLPAIEKQSIQMLIPMQHADGGWGWWTFDTSDPFMTAYVLDGLHQAAAQGYQVNREITDRGLAWAEKQIGSAAAKTWPKRDSLYLAYALALFSRADKAEAMLKQIDMSSASGPNLALAAMTDNLLGKAHLQGRDEYMQRLRQLVIEDTLTAHWKPENTDNTHWYDVEDLYGAELTSLPVLAMETITPDDPLIAKGVRWLLLNRQGEWWWSTRDSSFALMAIAGYIEKEQIPAGTSTVHMLINGQEIGKVQLTARNFVGGSETLTVPLRQMRTGQNEIQMKLEGGGQAYFTVDLQQYAVAPMLGKLLTGDDFSITRTFHGLESTRMEDGTLHLAESKDAITSAHAGDLIQVDIAVTTGHDRNYIMLEDPFPSNCFPAEGNEAETDMEWDFWYSNKEVYDDRVTFFAREMKAGTQHFTYILRAESPGISHALPPVASNMYNPTDRTSDAETVFEVKP